MPTAHLTDRAVVQVQGDDAKSFLQGLVTCNVETLQPGEARLGALLAPQGKILFDFLLVRLPEEGDPSATLGGGYLLDCRAEAAAGLAKRLTLYKLRSKVTIGQPSDAEPIGVTATWGGDGVQPDGAILARDGRLPELGVRRFLPDQEARAIEAVDAAAYHTHRIALGVPEGGVDFAFGDAFPHEALMDQLGGVDFRKGCYIGQEVVSRMQHRGTARNRILPLVYRDGEAAEPGSEVTSGSRVLGSTGSASGERGLAMIRIDRLGDALATGEPIRAGGRLVAVEKPTFATFAFPDDVAAAAG